MRGPWASAKTKMHFSGTKLLRHTQEQDLVEWLSKFFANQWQLPNLVNSQTSLLAARKADWGRYQVKGMARGNIWEFCAIFPILRFRNFAYHWSKWSQKGCNQRIKSIDWRLIRRVRMQSSVTGIYCTWYFPNLPTIYTSQFAFSHLSQLLWHSLPSFGSILIQFWHIE